MERPSLKNLVGPWKSKPVKIKEVNNLMDQLTIKVDEADALTASPSQTLPSPLPSPSIASMRLMVFNGQRQRARSLCLPDDFVPKDNKLGLDAGSIGNIPQKQESQSNVAATNFGRKRSISFTGYSADFYD